MVDIKGFILGAETIDKMRSSIKRVFGSLELVVKNQYDHNGYPEWKDVPYIDCGGVFIQLARNPNRAEPMLIWVSLDRNSPRSEWVCAREEFSLAETVAIYDKLSEIVMKFHEKFPLSGILDYFEKVRQIGERYAI